MPTISRFDYVVDYIDSHPEIASPSSFTLTEQDWQNFRQRVIDSGFSYDAVSKKQFDELVKTAKFEGYYDEAKDAFDALEKKLKHDVATELDKHRKTIQQILELDIVGAYYYQSGSVEAGLTNDKQLKEAVRLLKNPKEYKKILAPQKPKETSSVIKIEKKLPENITLQAPKEKIFNAIA